VKPAYRRYEITNDNPTLKGQFMKALAQALPHAQSISLENSHLLGRFENYDMLGWVSAYPPENGTAAEIDIQALYPGKNGEVRWRRLERLDGLHQYLAVYNKG